MHAHNMSANVILQNLLVGNVIAVSERNESAPQVSNPLIPIELNSRYQMYNSQRWQAALTLRKKESGAAAIRKCVAVMDGEEVLNVILKLADWSLGCYDVVEKSVFLNEKERVIGHSY